METRAFTNPFQGTKGPAEGAPTVSPRQQRGALEPPRKRTERKEWPP